jgi:hypothetical protein
MLSFRIMPFTASRYLSPASKLPPSNSSPPTPLPLDASSMGKMNTLSFGLAPPSLSYSSTMLSRSSGEDTEMRASRPSSGSWYLTAKCWPAAPPYASESRARRFGSVTPRGADTIRVSPPAYRSVPSAGRGMMRPPRLHSSFILSPPPPPPPPSSADPAVAAIRAVTPYPALPLSYRI